MKKITQEEFINKIKEIHGDKYDYSKIEYVNTRTKVCIICPEHGEFWQTPNDILHKKIGCPMCGIKKRAKNKTLTTEEFIKRGKEVHGDKYDYSKVKYKNNGTKVCIICPEHGEFWQTPNKHLLGQGCSICGKKTFIRKVSKTTEEFIENAKIVHGDKYDYSKVEYKNNHTKVCIICPEHGEFWQTPNAHLQGEGCSKCCGKFKINTNEFVEKAKHIHGDKYDYSKVEYKNNHTKVCIICPEHGEFWQTPSLHINQKCGCPICDESHLERETRKFLIENKIKFIQEAKFNWLGLQSLDFYLSDYNVAIECQGIQHFEPIDFSGKGNKYEKFNYVKKLDKRKKELCVNNNVKLYYINYNENIKEELNKILTNL